MSERIPAPEDADDQRGSEFDMSHTAEFAKMRAVMRASEKHREGGVDPELEVVLAQEALGVVRDVRLEGVAARLVALDVGERAVDPVAAVGVRPLPART